MEVKTINAIIVDDEKSNIENLENLLKKNCPDVNVLATANSSQQAMEVIARYQPELVFLDIEMPRGNGFDLLENLPEINFEIVFVTAYNQYAIKAIRFYALDYLLKPINVDELKTAVSRAKSKLRERKENERIQLLKQYLREPEKPKKIALPMADEIQFIEIDQILYCIGENNYTQFYLVNKSRILVTKTIKEFEELLSTHGFVRVHRSYIINLRYVKAYVKKEGGYILMINDAQISISRNKKEEVLQLLTKNTHLGS